MTRSAAIRRLSRTRARAAVTQRQARANWNAERLAAKREADARSAAEIAARAVERLEALADTETYLGRISDERRQNHLALKDRLCADVTRIVSDVNQMFSEFQTRSESRLQALADGRQDVAVMLAEFHLAREKMRQEQLSFGEALRQQLQADAARICREDFAGR
ncbi:hypothetical protein BRADO1284 [Bradyrhizobium sp. ORS 278]|uniref:hypothetical protein n=1 Tax=Bradyrhizobium sp. (strain ORS 278) TaxID=114615 RepID=UPI0001507DAB|nr:hypothetical protein [Bradyrhizobium sp. ORS 278]CAL75185.1 hypothetical protein BRADO1284 [Bradyrhizobium sp. ORS 278]